MSTARFVNHAYRDYSRFLLDGGELVKHKKSDRNFPRKVHQILTDGHEDVIVWMPHGRAFKVIDKERLISEVIPKYFVCRKYTTFTRQLNGWGFRRLYQSGQDHGCYYHGGYYLIENRARIEFLFQNLYHTHILACFFSGRVLPSRVNRIDRNDS